MPKVKKGSKKEAKASKDEEEKQIVVSSCIRPWLHFKNKF